VCIVAALGGMQGTKIQILFVILPSKQKKVLKNLEDKRKMSIFAASKGEFAERMTTFMACKGRFEPQI
jgi:hypothetical protein